MATVEFAKGEKSVTLHGYAVAAPKMTAHSGIIQAVHYDAATQHFTVTVMPDKAGDDFIRHVNLVLETK
jgi:hypothetical protein